MKVLLGILIGALVLASVPAGVAEASTLTYIRNVISTSAKNTGANHSIQFTTTTDIPASGQIEVRFHEGDFVIPADFDFQDVDMAVASGGPSTQRALASSADGTHDGVAAQIGTHGSILFTLNSTTGISPGSVVSITLGTSASFGVSGDSQITNPSTTGSYRVAIETFDSLGGSLDLARTMVSVIDQVTQTAISANIPPTRSNGLPAGVLEANNPAIEISLSTDEYATCRYATTTGVAYAAMTGTFSPTIGMSFGRVIYGHQNSSSYTYYVRCSDVGGTANDDDYAISFSLKATPDTNTSLGTDTGAGGSGGIGFFPGGSAVLFTASLTVSGWASPQSTVTFLNDGKVYGTALANAEGKFQKTITNLERGVHTVLTYALDRKGRKSAGNSSSISLGQATNNVLSNIVLPPTVELSKKSVEPGEVIKISGESIAGSEVEVSVVQQTKSGSATPKKLTATATKGIPDTLDGLWEVELNTAQLSRGTYEVKARATTPQKITTGVSTAQFLGVGQDAAPDLSNRADINKDGKVNIVDFSIMLTYWGTDNGDADINLDGGVNLADFSIMLFNWTG